MPEKTDHDKITEMHAVLLGANGHPGIAKQVDRNSKAIIRLWVVIAVILSSIGGGIYGVIEILRGM